MRNASNFKREIVLPLGAALIVMVLSSLGLWWAFLLVVCVAGVG
jgi:hypothetical protein